MGRTVALRPKPYTTVSVRRMKERLCDAIVERMESKGLKPADIHARYPR
jgi:hypothetical protein